LEGFALERDDACRLEIDRLAQLFPLVREMVS
jgi:hypothetical protein